MEAALAGEIQTALVIIAMVASYQFLDIIQRRYMHGITFYDWAGRLGVRRNYDKLNQEMNATSKSVRSLQDKVDKLSKSLETEMNLEINRFRKNLQDEMNQIIEDEAEYLKKFNFKHNSKHWREL